MGAHARRWTAARWAHAKDPFGAEGRIGPRRNGNLGTAAMGAAVRFGKGCRLLARDSLSRRNAVLTVRRCPELPVVGDG